MAATITYASAAFARRPFLRSHLKVDTVVVALRRRTRRIGFNLEPRMNANTREWSGSVVRFIRVNSRSFAVLFRVRMEGCDYEAESTCPVPDGPRLTRQVLCCAVPTLQDRKKRRRLRCEVSACVMGLGCRSAAEAVVVTGAREVCEHQRL